MTVLLLARDVRAEDPRVGLREQRLLAISRQVSVQAVSVVGLDVDPRRPSVAETCAIGCGDPLDLGLDGRRQVGERAVRAEDHEHVREAGRGHAQVAGRAVGPVLVDVLGRRGRGGRRAVVAVDGVEPGGEDQDVELVHGAVGGDDALLGELGDRVLLDRTR